MERGPIRRLAGLRDLSEAQQQLLKGAQDRLQRFFSLYDYRAVETPLLEETELFLRKAGGGIGARMYTFTDPGGHKVSLRPEFTSSIIRYYLQCQDREPLPVRWQYAGPVFRFEPPSPGVYRQFTQVGAELLGGSGPEADAEIVALAWHGLSSLGISKHQLHIGHIGALQGLLKEYRLSDRAREFLVGNVTQLGSGGEGRQEVQRRAQELGLLAQGRRDSLKSILDGLENEAARGMAEAFLKEGAADAVGRRTPEDIFARFLRKVRGSDDPTTVQDAMDFLGQLAQVKGSPEEALDRAREVTRGHGLKEEPFEQVQHLVQALKRHGLDGTHINLDFGLAREISYYSGVIFEVLHPLVADGASLGGGGRYDGLVRDLGGLGEVPALGFAYHLERVLDVLDGSTKGGDRATAVISRILLIPQTSEAYEHALRLASELRSKNRIVRLGFNCPSLQECLGYAALLGIDVVMVVDRKGQAKEYPVKAIQGAKRENVATSRSK